LLALWLLPAAAAWGQTTSMRQGVTRPVTTGTTDSATSLDYMGFIAWRSPTTGNKTQTLPACGSQINGVWITVIDAQSTAATYPITVQGASGTVNDAASAQLITTNLGAVTLVCDGGSTNWDVASMAAPPAPLPPPLPSTITGLTVSNTTYTSSTQGTVVGNLVLSGANNGATTFSLSGPDAARFQLSSPCTGASCSLQASGTEPDGFHDGRFLVFITPTLGGAKGSGVVYPFTINETVTCNQTVATGFTAANITSAISAASAGQNICIQGSGTVASTVNINKGVRLTGVNSSTNPTITVSGQIKAFTVTASNATLDHLAAIGTIPASPNFDTCNGNSFFLSTSTSAALSGLTVAYMNLSNFWCEFVYGGAGSGGSVTGLVHKYNYSTGNAYASATCDPCVGGVGANVMSNNLWQNGTVKSGEVNSYPFVASVVSERFV
jgi:hypothetical protein